MSSCYTLTCHYGWELSIQPFASKQSALLMLEPNSANLLASMKSTGRQNYSLTQLDFWLGNWLFGIQVLPCLVHFRCILGSSMEVWKKSILVHCSSNWFLHVKEVPNWVYTSMNPNRLLCIQIQMLAPSMFKRKEIIDFVSETTIGESQVTSFQWKVPLSGKDNSIVSVSWTLQFHSMIFFLVTKFLKLPLMLTTLNSSLVTMTLQIWIRMCVTARIRAHTSKRVSQWV